MNIDYEALRKRIRDECLAAHFGGGVEPALMDALDVEHAPQEELVRISKLWGIDIRKFMR